MTIDTVCFNGDGSLRAVELTIVPQDVDDIGGPVLLRGDALLAAQPHPEDEGLSRIFVQGMVPLIVRHPYKEIRACMMDRDSFRNMMAGEERG